MNTISQNNESMSSICTETLHTCEADVNGVRCQVRTLEYFTTSQGEKRYICDYHFRELLRLVKLHYFMRETYAGMFNEGGRVA